MLKMFSTQLTGLFMRIADKEEFQFEDGARLLAQAAVGHGAIYFKGFGEMRGVEFEAIEGAEPLESAKRSRIYRQPNSSRSGYHSEPLFQ